MMGFGESSWPISPPPPRLLSYVGAHAKNVSNIGGIRETLNTVIALTL